MRLIYKFILAAALLASSLTATAQQAQTDAFTYYASELNTEDGALVLRDRLQKFAKDACEADVPRGSALRSTIDLERCEIRVVKELMREIDHPTLYKVHDRTDPQSSI